MELLEKGELVREGAELVDRAIVVDEGGDDQVGVTVNAEGGDTKAQGMVDLGIQVRLGQGRGNVDRPSGRRPTAGAGRRT